jgi:predicted GNAT superfamily acetyltransferase
MRALEIIHKKKGMSFLFKVETSHDQGDYEKYEELRFEIWGMSNDSMAGLRNMCSENYFSDGNCLFIAVYAEDDKGHFEQDREHLVGFSYGYVGIKDQKTGFREPDNVVFYSLYTGVREEYQHFGLGVLMKEFQGDVVRDVFGIHIITCTFDPLTGVNAYRNIHCFGMDVVEYREDCYSGFAGKLNRADVPSDRLYVSWDFDKPVQRPVYDLQGLVYSGDMAVTAKIEKVKGRSGPVLLDVVEKADPESDREFLLVEIPFDFYRILRETDVRDKRVRRIPIEWREATRSVIQDLLRRQYRIVDFRWFQEGTRKRDFYVFQKIPI